MPLCECAVAPSLPISWSQPAPLLLPSPHPPSCWSTIRNPFSYSQSSIHRTSSPLTSFPFIIHPLLSSPCTSLPLDLRHWINSPFTSLYLDSLRFISPHQLSLQVPSPHLPSPHLICLNISSFHLPSLPGLRCQANSPEDTARQRWRHPILWARKLGHQSHRRWSTFWSFLNHHDHTSIIFSFLIYTFYLSYCIRQSLSPLLSSFLSFVLSFFHSFSYFLSFVLSFFLSLTFPIWIILLLFFWPISYRLANSKRPHSYFFLASFLNYLFT